MGFTIEDMLLVSEKRYQMKLVAGSNGWSNSISWLLMLEDTTIIRRFTGKELAVTTGLGFQSEEALLALADQLISHHAAGLIINIGPYVQEIPGSLLTRCSENDFPLLTVPWSVKLVDMIKDLTIRVFLTSSADEQISQAYIHAIEEPEARDRYVKDLLPYYDVDGTYQIALVSTGDLDSMDTVERKRIGYRMQLYLNNLTHNGHFFYYASYFVIIMNAMTKEQVRRIVDDFAAKIQRRMTEDSVVIGVSSQVTDITNLHVAYARAKAAVQMACARKMALQYFDDMGIYRLLFSVQDTALLRELCEKPLAPLLEYDKAHGSEYINTLALYLKYDGSIQKVAAELFVHRNTIQYRMNNIRQLLDCQLETQQERMPYYVACLIYDMRLLN